MKKTSESPEFHTEKEIERKRKEIRELVERIDSGLILHEIIRFIENIQK